MGSRYSCVGALVPVLAFTGLASILVCDRAGAGAGEPGVVRGVVWNSDNSPVPNAKVRLRDLVTGHIASTSETSTTGQFLFAPVVQSWYLVELVSEKGRVVAVGPSFRVASGETVSTVVRLQARRSSFAAMFSNTAAAVIAAASLVGLTAIGSDARPISPQ